MESSWDTLSKGRQRQKGHLLQGRFRTALRLVVIAVRLKDEGVRVFDVSWNELMQFQEKLIDSRRILNGHWSLALKRTERLRFWPAQCAKQSSSLLLISLCAGAT